MYQKYFKRPLDVVVSLVALLLLGPLLLILIVSVRINLVRSVFVIQERPGLNEKNFTLYKFRTMNNKKDRDGMLLPDEARLTGFGQILRSTSLDELPELINILKGDMSLIGPRPLLVEYLPLYNQTQKRRHEVRPGLSGLAQINGRNALSWEDKFRMDLQYIDNISFLGDLVILFLTIKKVFIREGINSECAATMEVFRGTKNAEESVK